MSCEYFQKGFFKGVDSLMGRVLGGFWYAEAELMKTYWPVFPRNISKPARA